MNMIPFYFFFSRWPLCASLREMIHIKSFPRSLWYAAGQFMTAKYSESLHSETSSVWCMSCISILFLTGHPLICSLFSFMLKGFSFPIQKLIEWEVLLSQHVWFPDSHKEDGGSRPDAHSDMMASVSPCFQYSSLLGVNVGTPCTSSHFVAFSILQYDFLCDHWVLQNIFSPVPACHLSNGQTSNGNATEEILASNSKSPDQTFSCSALWQRTFFYYRLLFYIDCEYTFLPPNHYTCLSYEESLLWRYYSS